MRKPAADQDLSLRSSVVFDMPAIIHGAEIHKLVGSCRPLDLNSAYAYLLLCEHFADTCVRAEHAGDTVGFISAYRPPRRPDVLFVWQVATVPSMRGRGLARAMLHELLRRDALGECRYVETTVSPSNEPSRRLFYAFARDLGAPVAEKVLFSERDFGAEPHEQEILFRIGPIAGKRNHQEIPA